MIAAAPTFPRDRDVLDCVEVNLALLLMRAGVADPLDLLGTQWTFALTGDPLPLPVLAHTDPLTLFHTHRLARADQIAPLVAAHGDTLVFADAYWLPWLPMHLQQHVEHTAVVTSVADGTIRVLDAYTADTEWGQARPAEAVLTVADLDRAVRGHTGPGRLRAVTLPAGARPAARPVADLLRANVRATDATVIGARTVERFAAPYRGIGADLAGWRRFELGCWMVARARAAHARWLTRCRSGLSAALLQEVADLAAAWQQTSRLAYVTRRRVAAGRDAGPALADEVATTQQDREHRAAARLAEEVA